MEWNHLPNAGGLYDQSPRLLDAWLHIWAKKAEKQKADEQRRQAESKQMRRR